MSLDPQPSKQTVDLTRKTSGNYVFAYFVTVWPYNGFKKEEVYAEKNTFEVKAMDFDEAAEKAAIICHAISLGHHVWKVNLDGVMKK